MTREDATVVVEDHIRWLMGAGDRKTVAHALQTLFLEMGKEAGERERAERDRERARCAELAARAADGQDEAGEEADCSSDDEAFDHAASELRNLRQKILAGSQPSLTPRPSPEPR